MKNTHIKTMKLVFSRFESFENTRIRIILINKIEVTKNLSQNVVHSDLDFILRNWSVLIDNELTNLNSPEDFTKKTNSYYPQENLNLYALQSTDFSLIYLNMLKNRLLNTSNLSFHLEIQLLELIIKSHH